MSSKRLESNHALNKKGKTDAQPFMTLKKERKKEKKGADSIADVRSFPLNTTIYKTENIRELQCMSNHTYRHLGLGYLFSSILSIKCASTMYMNPLDMLCCEINAFMNYAPFS
jgi:hypothetical protein